MTPGPQKAELAFALLNEDQIRVDVDCVANAACDRTVVGMEAVDSLGDCPLLWLDVERIGYPDPYDDQDAFFLFDLADDIGEQASFTCGDVARLQRAAKCSRQSTAGGSHHIVQSRCVGFVDGRVHPIVGRHLGMNAESRRFVLGRQVGSAEGTCDALDPYT